MKNNTTLEDRHRKSDTRETQRETSCITDEEKEKHPYQTRGNYQVFEELLFELRIFLIILSFLLSPAVPGSMTNTVDRQHDE